MARNASELERLADELAKLSTDERVRVLDSVARRATPMRGVVYVPWENLRRLKGLVRLGGNAVEDCERLYDG